MLAVGEGTGKKGSSSGKGDLTLEIGNDWILDSRSSRHLINDESLFKMCENGSTSAI